MKCQQENYITSHDILIGLKLLKSNKLDRQTRQQTDKKTDSWYMRQTSQGTDKIQALFSSF